MNEEQFPTKIIVDFTDASEPIDQFLDLLFGKGVGFVAVSFGRIPATPTFYKWPDQKPDLFAEVERRQATDNVFFCPALRANEGALKLPVNCRDDETPSLPVEPMPCLWADVDLAGKDGTARTVDLELLDALGGIQVQSGTPRHVHWYGPLTDGVALTEFDRLNTDLKNALGADAKQANVSWLRWPTSINHKKTAQRRVRLPEDLSDVKVNVADVETLIRSHTPPTIVNEQRSRTRAPSAQASTERRVLRFLDRYANVPEGERSDKFHAVVLAGVEDGVGVDRLQDLLTGHALAERYQQQGRLRGEIERVADKGTTPRPAGTADSDFASQMVDGGSFIFDAPDKVPALWGDGDGQVLWAEGQPLMITGPIGVGKTTLSAQLTEARLGLRDEVLGFQVQPGKRRLLYLAMDRPLQIAGALGRLLKHHPREYLAERLIAWQGPPPEDLSRSPNLLHELVVAAGADTVIVDSLKDAVTKLTDDETGGGWNRAVQKCIAAGIQVIVLHHQRKPSSGNAEKPKTVGDVYGSTWLAAGMGSILLLWGSPGAGRIELSHLRPPSTPLEPMWVLHDHTAGTMTPEAQHEDLLSLFATPTPIRRLAMDMSASGEPRPGEVEKARRQVAAWVNSGLLKSAGKSRVGTGKPAQLFVRTDLA